MSASNIDNLQGDAETQDVDAPIRVGSGEFYMDVAIGTPPLTISAIVDTGSDLVWTKCKPCSDCPTSAYDPSSSSSYSKVPCSNDLCAPAQMFSCSNNGDCAYTYSYGDQSSSSGVLSYETFTLSSQSLPHIAFGCAQENKGQGFQDVGGLVGFGRSPLSFISQLGPSVVNKFSYCLVSLTDSPSKTSALIIGDSASSNAKSVNFTGIIRSSTNPTFYYLSLEDIRVGGQSLGIAPGTFDLQSDGSGGFIIDFGTTFTYLQESAYDAVKQALTSSVNHPQADGSSIGLDLCFNQQGSSSSIFPTITFHFKGADFDLPQENYLLASSSDVVCLAMLSTNQGFSIFGNVQQQNYQIVYDNDNNVHSFAPAVCDSL